MGTGAPLAREELVSAGVEHHADKTAPFVDTGDAYRPVRNPVEVVHCAVERIDVPGATRAAALERALLRDDRVLREGPADRGHDRQLGLPIGVGHEIGEARFRADAGRLASEAFEQLPAGDARGVHRDGEGIRHQRCCDASRMPKATNTVPTTPSRARRIVGRASTSPARLTANAYAASHASVMEQNTRPRPSIPTKAAGPAGANCGSRLVKNTPIFGLPRLLRRPCRSAAAGVSRFTCRGATACASPPLIAARSACAPR